MATAPDASAASTPLLQVAGGVATITLNRPAHRNRLEQEDLRTLLRQFEQIDADAQIRVLRLTANTQGQPKPVFCAGYHIGSFSEQDNDAGLFPLVADALAALRPITVCALNGSVYGGATDLLLACDLAVGLAGTELRMPATALGLHYYPGGLSRYVQRMGISGAKRAFLTARPFTADMLLHLGCLEAVAAPADFEATVSRLVADVADLAPLAAQITKVSLNEIAQGQADADVLRGREAASMQTRDFVEGRAAFQERRKPQFVGQ